MKQALVIIGAKSGRLGNRLAKFSHFIAFSEKHGVPIASMSFDEYSNYFEGTRNSLCCFYPAGFGIADHPMAVKFLELYREFALSTLKLFDLNKSNIQRLHDFVSAAPTAELDSQPSSVLRKILGLMSHVVGEWEANNEKSAEHIRIIRTSDDNDRFDLSSPEFLKLCEEPVIIICQGWLFRDDANFPLYGDRSKTYFTPSAELRSNIDAHLAACRKGVDRLIGVHIRQGDMRDFLGGRLFFETSKYADLMRRVVELFPNENIRFLVCSDEKQKLAQFNGLDVCMGTGQVVEDLYCLAGVDHLLAIPSTFSAWAKFVGNPQLYCFEDISEPITLINGAIVAKTS